MIPSGLLGLQYSAAPATGLQSISLEEIFKHPDQVLPVVAGNFKANWFEMAIASLGTRMVFKFAKKTLRGPIANINRQLKTAGIDTLVRL